jgi:hypothetical protein
LNTRSIRAFINRPPILGVSLLLLLLLTPLPGEARQLSFSRDGPTLHYRWQPPATNIAVQDTTNNAATSSTKGQPQELTLTLPAQSELRFFRAWRPDAVRRTLYTRLLQSARQQWPEVRFELKQQDPWSLAIHPQDPAQLPAVQQWLATEEKTQFEALLKESYQIIGQDALGQAGIKPDHVRIIDTSSSELGDVAEALLQAAGGEQVEPRQLLDYLLAFVQSIPYNALQSTDGERGTGFLLPRQVLENNQGDCDSKVALLASLWRYLKPEIPQVLLFVPDHALLGVALPAQGNDETVVAAGYPLLLVEPTGPAELPAGQIGAESRLYIKAGSYTAEPVQTTDTNSTPSR